MKQCSRCGRVKDIGEFSRQKNGKDGVRSQCKTCCNEQAKAYHEANRERCLARSKAWHEANRERRRDHDKAWYEANRERRRADHKAWYEASPEKYRDRSKAYQKAHPEKIRAQHHRRRARKKAALGSHTGQDIIRQGEMQKWVCWWKLPGCTGYCKADYHVDHRIPLCRGGSDNPDNIVISCPHCNLVKGSKMPDEFGVLL